MIRRCRKKQIAEEIISTTVIRSVEDDLPRMIENIAPFDLSRIYKPHNWSNEDVYPLNFYS